MVEAPTEEECEDLANEVVSQVYALGLASF
jgi:hypothetical protein